MGLAIFDSRKVASPMGLATFILLKWPVPWDWPLLTQEKWPVPWDWPFLVFKLKVASPILDIGIRKTGQSLGTGHFLWKISGQSHGQSHF